jgi:hypothetical protein
LKVLVLQFLISVILLATVALVYRQWIQPRTELNRQQQGVLILVGLTMMGGVLGSPFWWLDLSDSFAWDLPPLASRMLAAAGLAFGIVCFFTLQQPTRANLNLVLVMLVVYLPPLALAIAIFHLERFDFSNPLTYAFFGLAFGIAGGAIWYLWRPVEILPDKAGTCSPLLQNWLMLLAVLMGLWGMALFVTDNGFSDLVWVWPGDDLTSRLIAVMLLTIAAGAIVTRSNLDSARVFLNGVSVYGLGVMVANLWNLVNDKPVKLAYVLVFGVMGAVSFLLLWMTRPTTST